MNDQNLFDTKLMKDDEVLTVRTDPDEITQQACESFGTRFEGISTFEQWKVPEICFDEFSIGVIHGGSGTGKSTLLNRLGEVQSVEWNHNKAVVSHFDSLDEASEKFGAVGFNTVPSWFKPFHILSNGEQFRADLARRISSNCIVDEFTSVVERNLAISTSIALRKYIKRNKLKNVVLATCHEDILPHLMPDWVIDTNEGEIELNPFQKSQRVFSEFFNAHHLFGKNLGSITI